jgi:hypothetical protein
MSSLPRIFKKVVAACIHGWRWLTELAHSEMVSKAWTTKYSSAPLCTDSVSYLDSHWLYNAGTLKMTNRLHLNLTIDGLE